ncbi:Putative transcriptional regulator, MerR-family [Corynebacterium glyciniphilum AJ 3170]|uniref:Putative transcriptional regulator, MerR-family n=1 Tax=Corynebacterium glyciniphilum AJ 3170 TaxID=1404245 RepID=X5EEX3_9CORY|nr:MarR family transcriptional regulator [Corynebacterium glyciniphilum]AHW65161.1 Putative transcriptional regulator, MerR-family [Corynebacterium glyciniphilum AJ 3170]
MSVAKDLRSETVELWKRAVPDLDERTMTVVALIKSISESIDRASEWACRDSVISAAELEVLVPLRHATARLTAARLAERLGMSRAGVSKHLSRLESRGLLVRVASQEDSRTSIINLTDEGAAAVDEAFLRELEVHGQLLGANVGDRSDVGLLRQIDEALSGGLQELRRD